VFALGVLSAIIFANSLSRPVRSNDWNSDKLIAGSFSADPKDNKPPTIRVGIRIILECMIIECSLRCDEWCGSWGIALRWYEVITITSPPPRHGKKQELHFKLLLSG
jgi:hypothetical protein